MRYGLFVPGAGASLAQLVQLARSAEQAGFDSFYVAEAFRSGFVTLSAIAAGTEKIDIGPYILNAYARAPLITAMSAIDLDELSGGRLVLGVGVGNKHINAAWLGMPHDRPIRKIEEYVTLLRLAVAARKGEPVTFEGQMHRMNWAPSVDPVRPSIPVVMAASYPRTMKVAARVADGIALVGLQSPRYLAEVIRPLLEGASSEAGRDPASFRIIATPFLSMNEDAETARRSAREAICRTFHPIPHPYLEYALEEQGFSSLVEAARRHVPEGRMEQAMEAISDEALDQLTVCGTPETCLARIAEFDGIVDELLLFNAESPAYVQHENGAPPVDWVKSHDATVELGRRAKAEG